jgi:hypothetical protein
VTARYVDIDPEAIFIRMRVDPSWWHIIDAEHELTWCGLFLSQGSERRSLGGTLEDRRCMTRITRFGENVVRGPRHLSRWRIAAGPVRRSNARRTPPR